MLTKDVQRIPMGLLADGPTAQKRPNTPYALHAGTGD
jgi:hypothetical protein